MTKSVVAVAVGLLVAAILIGLVELAGRFVVLPTDVDPFDRMNLDTLRTLMNESLTASQGFAPKTSPSNR